MDSLHESILKLLVEQLDARSKCAVISTSRSLKEIATLPCQWQHLVFVNAEEQEGLRAGDVRKLMQRAQGDVRTLQLATRCAEAQEAQQRQRFLDGYKINQAMPHTRGAAAFELAVLCPNLQHLSLDERSSCLGGVTNDLCKALAQHCPLLRSLEAHFKRYSCASALLTDEGVIGLSEGCRQLHAVRLYNCDCVGDRSLYALAANCLQLQELCIGGYNENTTDGGLTVLAEAATQLRRVRLSSKLLKVGDATVLSLAHNCRQLTALKLPRCISDAALAMLAAAQLPELRHLDISKCDQLTAAGVAQLRASCRRLQRVMLPDHVRLEQELLDGGSEDSEPALGGPSPVSTCA